MDELLCGRFFRKQLHLQSFLEHQLIVKLHDFRRSFVDDYLYYLCVAYVNFVFFVLYFEKWFFYFFLLFTVHRFLLHIGCSAVQEGKPFYRGNVKESHQRLHIKFVCLRYLNQVTFVLLLFLFPVLHHISRLRPRLRFQNNFITLWEYFYQFFR